MVGRHRPKASVPPPASKRGGAEGRSGDSPPGKRAQGSRYGVGGGTLAFGRSHPTPVAPAMPRAASIDRP